MAGKLIDECWAEFEIPEPGWYSDKYEVCAALVFSKSEIQKWFIVDRSLKGKLEFLKKKTDK